MNIKLSNILSSVSESNTLLANGMIQDAVLLSGEALANAYELWSAAMNTHSPTEQEINVMAIAASCHCGALVMMGNFHDAYATAIGAILQISIDTSGTTDTMQPLLSIYTTAVFALMNQLTRLPSDETTSAHLQTIMRYLSSMLYYYYNNVGHTNPDSPYLESAYQALCHAKQLTNIETPRITVINEQIDPQSPNALIGDLVGRSQALFLLTD